MHSVLLLTFAACTEAPAPERPAPEVPAPQPPTPEASEPSTGIVPPPPPEGLAGVDVVGHGLRITMYPPFQLALVPTPSFDPRAPKPAESEATPLILSWWDVSDPRVGSDGGRGGLVVSSVVAAPVPEGEPAIQRRLVTPPRGREVVRYQLGDSGSYVQLPVRLREHGGMFDLQPGPAEASWAIEVDGTRTPIPARTFVHSADPASGRPFDMSEKPHQPWGPWPGQR